MEVPAILSPTPARQGTMLLYVIVEMGCPSLIGETILQHFPSGMGNTEFFHFILD